MTFIQSVMKTKHPEYSLTVDGSGGIRTNTRYDKINETNITYYTNAAGGGGGG